MLSSSSNIFFTEQKPLFIHTSVTPAVVSYIVLTAGLDRGCQLAPTAPSSYCGLTCSTQVVQQIITGAIKGHIQLRTDRDNIHCLCWKRVRRHLGPASEQTAALWCPAGPASPSGGSFEPPAWLSCPETEPPAVGTPPSRVSY